MTRVAKGTSAGFTLLEVLVALAVLGLLTGLLAAGLRVGLQAWRRETRLLHAHADLDATDRALRRLIATMEPGTIGAPPLIAGSADRLAFSAMLPPGAGITGPADLLLMVDQDHRLVLRYRPHRHVIALRPPPPMRETVLLGDVARLDLAYWPRGAPFGWRRAWTGPVLPGLVRLRIVFPDGDPRHWPAVVARPMRVAAP